MAASAASASNTLPPMRRVAARRRAAGVAHGRGSLMSRSLLQEPQPQDDGGEVLSAGAISRRTCTASRRHPASSSLHQRPRPSQRGVPPLACLRMAQNLPRVCQALPMRVTRTAGGTHVVHVRGFSRLQEQQRGGVVGEGGGFVDSPAFAVAGLHWAVRYYPGSDDGGGGDGGRVGAFVRLLTEGAVARAYVGLRLLDQATGVADTVFWDHRPTRFVAASADRCSWGTGYVAMRSELLGTGFVRGDCLKIECVIEVCRDG